MRQGGQAEQLRPLPSAGEEGIRHGVGHFFGTTHLFVHVWKEHQRRPCEAVRGDSKLYAWQECARWVEQDKQRAP